MIALSEAGKTAEAQSALEGPLDTYLMAIVNNLLALRSVGRSQATGYRHQRKAETSQVAQ